MGILIFFDLELVSGILVGEMGVFCFYGISVRGEVS